jgi:hypothetical protein
VAAATGVGLVEEGNIPQVVQEEAAVRVGGVASEVQGEQVAQVVVKVEDKQS